MFTYQIAPGTVDVSVVIRIIDSTDGTPETGVVFNTSGIDIQYRREGAASTAITEATLAALTTAHTDGGFLHIGNGYYRLDLPDAACATGAAGCLVHGTVTGMVVIGCYIQLEAAVNKVYSDTTIIYSDTTIATSKATQIYSDTAIASSKAVQIYSDTTIIYSDTTVVTSKTTQIYSDTTAIHTQTTTASSKATQIYSDTTIIASDTTLLEASRGVVDEGTAQSATGTTLVLRAAAAFADDELIGQTVQIISATAGAGQSRLITDNVGATDTITVATWTTTPTGTITYKIFATAPESSALSVAQDSKLTKINSKATQIYSDTTIIYSDTTIATSKTTQIYSDTTAIHTQTTTASSKSTQIYSDTTIAVSKAVQIYSDTTAIAAAGGSLTVAQDSKLTRVNSKATQIYSDTTAVEAGGGSLTVAQDSKLTRVNSKATQIYSDTTAVDSKAVKVYSDTTIIYSDTTIATSKATQIYSDTTIASAAVVATYQKNVAANDIPFVLVDSTDHVTRKTGITVTATRSIDGGAFGAATGIVAEVASGVYVLDASQADMNGDNIVFRFTGAACDPVELHIKTYT